METGFPGPMWCDGLTSTGADYREENEQNQRKKTPLTWDSQHARQDIQTVPRLKEKSKPSPLVADSHTHAYKQSKKNSSQHREAASVYEQTNTH